MNLKISNRPPLGHYPVAFAFSAESANVSVAVAAASGPHFHSINRLGGNTAKSLVVRKEFPETFILDLLNVTDRFVTARFLWYVV